MTIQPKCPFAGHERAPTHLGGQSVRDWWPNQLNLKILHQNPQEARPVTPGFNYAEAFRSLDFAALKEDLRKVMRDSKDWWPADFGHYGPFFIRLAWHSVGTYRIIDGRGGGARGNIRFAPVNSWPDNVNLDKAKRLLWPVKQKYGDAISWADLIVLAGTVALEDMGLKIAGFSGGRTDIWEPEEDIYWGPEVEWLASRRRTDGEELEGPLAATQMGLIYVNPEGVDGEPDVLRAARDIRMSFARMGMNDEETVALIAGGHSFGKTHGAAPVEKYVGPEPEAAPIEQMGLGWKNSYRTGKGPDTIGSGLEGAWTPTPTQFDNSFLEILFRYDWNLTKSPAGHWQWVAVNPAEEHMVPDAHIPGKKHPPIMFTTDLALRMDPVYEPIARRFRDHPEEFAEAFAKAWFKLTHRDMGPRSRWLGPDLPPPEAWHDPLPESPYAPLDEEDIRMLKKQVLASGLTVRELAYVAFSSAASYRESDRRGGANGARIRLNPMRNWEVNMPDRLQKVLDVLEGIRQAFNEQAGNGKGISLADLIVLAGCAAVEKAANDAGFDIEVPFTPGRVDVEQGDFDEELHALLEPVADGFRGYVRPDCDAPAEELLLDRAKQLNLTAPEMTVLWAGMRSLGATFGDAPHGVLTDRPGVLDGQVLDNLLSMDWEWRPSAQGPGIYEAVERETGAVKWTATRADLVFGANSQLRAIAEYYAQTDRREQFVRDFVKVWDKVMMLDRFDVNWR